MSLLALGINHQTAPVELRDRGSNTLARERVGQHVANAVGHCFDVAGNQRGRCFVNQQFRSLGHESECGN